ncbi:MAG: hypothetical protein H0U10_07710 [Chloroflexia bacterium]|nr:hypothetical protein [Chloroflexia bacterium]
MPLAVGALVLGGCGQTEPTIPDQPPPSATVTPTDLAPATPRPPGDGAAAATPGASPVTFGDLADRVDAAWADVRTYRAVFEAASPATPPLATPALSVDATRGATPIGGALGPLATPVIGSPFVAVREVILPDRQRQTLTGTASDDHEAIVVDGTLYLRGPLADELLPGTSDAVWLSIPLSELPAESAAGHLLVGLTVPPTSPMAGLREGLRPQELRTIGPVEIEGRSCIAYGGADTTAIGTRQDITVAVAADGLPCSIETHVGTDLVSRIVYTDFDLPLSIEPPAVATPVAGLLPAATPVARD